MKNVDHDAVWVAYEIPQLLFVEKIVVIPEFLTVQGAIARQWHNSRTIYTSSSSRHLSWRLLQLLWCMYNSPCGITCMENVDHVEVWRALLNEVVSEEHTHDGRCDGNVLVDFECT